LEINWTDNYANTFTLRSTKAIYLLPGELWGKSEEIRPIVESLGKVVCRSTKAAISLIRVKKDRGKVTAYRNSSTLFRTVPSQTPYDHLFLKIVL